ncbi:MAG: VOC family protein [Proteobacteria bacterium]|jgi:catechol 2,3-dioxygenase-like lactoylglutathione lyase family enzyme|nr:VOC family protein [Pseudomonadota bacterium]
MKPTYDHALTFLWVTDWDRALRFYTEVLGFRKDYESEGWAELAVPGVKDSFVALNRIAAGSELPRNEFVTLRVPDLDAFRAYLAGSGVFLKGDVVDFRDEGQGMRMFKFLDPDGNVITASQIER